VPSFRLLFQELDIPKADLTIKATGKQWYWSYAYPETAVRIRFAAGPGQEAPCSGR